MKPKKAEKFSVILASVGVMLVLLTFFDVLPDWQGAMLFSGVVCFIAAFMYKQLGSRN